MKLQVKHRLSFFYVERGSLSVLDGSLVLTDSVHGTRLEVPARAATCIMVGPGTAVTTDAVRQLAHDRSSSWEIRQAARKDGMHTLREDAWCKVLNGITTVDEVLRVTKGDRL